YVQMPAAAARRSRTASGNRKLRLTGKEWRFPGASLRPSAPRLVLPGGLAEGALGEAHVHVLPEGDLPVEDAGLDHQVGDQIEVGLARREPRVDDAVEWLGQGMTQDLRPLAVVVTGDEVRGVLAMRPALVQPKPRTGDAVDQDLHGFGPAVDHVLADHDHAGH